MLKRAGLLISHRAFVTRLPSRVVLGGLTLAVGISGCGASLSTTRNAQAGAGTPATSSHRPLRSAAGAPPGPAASQADLPAGWQRLSSVHGRAAVASRTVVAGGAITTLVRFDSLTTRLVLHPGYQDPGGSGWSTHSLVLPAERPVLLAAFNGGFKLGAGAGGMAVGSRQAGTLRPGLASVVTYPDGSAQIGSWGQQLPGAGRGVSSVRQNLRLLVSAGRPASDIDVIRDWGATLLGMTLVARSALGIDRQGNLVWAGSMAATPRALPKPLSARVSSGPWSWTSTPSGFVPSPSRP